MNIKKVTPKSLSGFMELFPSKQVVFESILDVLRNVYVSYGFYPLDTPILEHSSILLAKAGGETEKQIYRFTKGDTDLTMRFDLTVPLAKYVAMNYHKLTFPFKRFQIGKVYRGERAQRGRYREFYQADIDVVGDGELSIINDAEIPSIIYDIFSRLGLQDFTIRINNRKILSGFLKTLDLADKAADILHIIDKLAKIGKEKVGEELISLGMTSAVSEKIIDFVSAGGTNKDKLKKLDQYAGQNGLLDEGIKELRLVLDYIKAFGVPEGNYAADFSIVRGLDYYTGTVYETIINSHPEIGSVCSGGRYDDLAAHYTDKALPGVGISIGLTRLFYVLDEMKAFGEDVGAPVDVLLIPKTADISKAIAVSKEIQKAEIRVQVFFEDKKFKKKMQYADQLKVPFVMLLGEDEISSGKVSLKQMIDGTQITVELPEAIAAIKGFVDKEKKHIIKNMENFFCN